LNSRRPFSGELPAFTSVNSWICRRLTLTNRRKILLPSTLNNFNNNFSSNSSITLRKFSFNNLFNLPLNHQMTLAAKVRKTAPLLALFADLPVLIFVSSQSTIGPQGLRSMSHRKDEMQRGFALPGPQ
jgi:hypothetical protein